MLRVNRARTSASSFARAHNLCCKGTGGVFTIIGLSFLIAGSVLISQNKNSFSNHFGDFDDFDFDFDVANNMKFAGGVALVFFGIIFSVIGLICFACACCSRAAAHDEAFVPSQLPQNTGVKAYPQQEAGAGNFNPVQMPQPFLQGPAGYLQGPPMYPQGQSQYPQGPAPYSGNLYPQDPPNYAQAVSMPTQAYGVTAVPPQQQMGPPTLPLTFPAPSAPLADEQIPEKM